MKNLSFVGHHSQNSIQNETYDMVALRKKTTQQAARSGIDPLLKKISRFPLLKRAFFANLYCIAVVLKQH